MNSLRGQLVRALALATCGLVAGGGLAIFFVTRGVLLDQFDDTLAAKANALVTASEIDDGEFEIDLTVQDFAGFGRGGDDYFEIRFPDGSLLAASPSLDSTAIRPLETADPPAAVPPGLATGTLADGRHARFFRATFTPKDDTRREHADLRLTVASPLRPVSSHLWVLACVIAGVAAVTCAVILPVIRSVLARGLRPVEKLGSQVASISVDALDRRLDLAGQPEELVPLGRGLNQWLDRLEASVERERHFSSHAAHELRTPLAELRMIAELGATWPDQANPDQCRAMLATIDELSSLVDTLSLLARADSGNVPLTPEAVDRAAAVDSMLTRYTSEIAARNLHVRTDILPGTCFIDPTLWNTILQNLIGNAVSHSPTGSRIQIRQDNDTFQIANPAPDLTNTDLTHLFHRFWRKDESRQDRSHSGLGLSIVRAFATVAGASIRADLDEPGILRITVSLPAQSP